MMVMMMMMQWHAGVGSETVSGIASKSKLGVGSEVPTLRTSGGPSLGFTVPASPLA